MNELLIDGLIIIGMVIFALCFLMGVVILYITKKVNNFNDTYLNCLETNEKFMDKQ